MNTHTQDRECLDIDTVSTQDLRLAVERISTGDFYFLSDAGETIGKVRPTNDRDDLRLPFLSRPHGINSVIRAPLERQPRRIKIQMTDFDDLKTQVVELLQKCRDGDLNMTIHVTLYHKACLTITSF